MGVKGGLRRQCSGIKAHRHWHRIARTDWRRVPPPLSPASIFDRAWSTCDYNQYSATAGHQAASRVAFPKSPAPCCVSFQTAWGRLRRRTSQSLWHTFVVAPCVSPCAPPPGTRPWPLLALTARFESRSSSNTTAVRHMRRLDGGNGNREFVYVLLRSLVASCLLLAVPSLSLLVAVAAASS